MRLVAGACLLLMMSSALAMAGTTRKCVRDAGWFSEPQWKPMDRKAFWKPLEDRKWFWERDRK